MTRSTVYTSIEISEITVSTIRNIVFENQLNRRIAYKRNHRLVQIPQKHLDKINKVN